MAVTEQVKSVRKSRQLQEMSWNEIEHPGSYLFIETGELVRIPGEALAPGHSPLIRLTSVGGEPRVAKLSEDPATPISVLRAIAADNDYAVNF